MERIQNQFGSIEQVQNQYLGKNSRPVSGPSDQVTSFTDILSEKFGIQTESNQSIRFSKHATERLFDRNITLTKEQNERLQEGVQKAGEKGINESLVVIDSLAFIVNVPSQTVVTAMDQTNTTDSNVFTNIDGAVIA